MRRSLFILGVILLVSIFAASLAPFDPMLTEPSIQLQAPSYTHLFGTDLFGRDILSRTLYGGQHTVIITALATSISCIFGGIIGLGAGVMRGKLNQIIVLFINAILAFPGLLLALIVLTILGTGGMSLALATGITQIAPYAQVVRAAFISTRSKQYVQAGYALGGTNLHIINNHILPTIRPTLLAYTAVTFSYCLINATSLSFLGLGGDPGIPDWGVMLAEGRAIFRLAPWAAIVPGIMITVIVMTINHLTEELAHTQF
jgi:peptide/nickel transport system permease protein